MPAPYTKNISAPLPPPREDTTVNYVQLPENVQWLSGVRGFHKRPGSVPFSLVPRNASLETILTIGVVPTPETYRPFVSGDTNIPDTVAPTILVGRFYNTVPSTNNAFIALRKARAIQFDTTLDTFLTRHPTDSASIAYSYRRPYNGSTASTVVNTLTTTIGELVVGTDTLVNGRGQAAALAITAGPSNHRKHDVSAIFLVPNTENLYTHVADVVGGNAATVFSSAFRLINGGRLDYLTVNGSVFVAGCGGTVYGFDGYRTYIAGALPGDVPFGFEFSAESLSGTIPPGTYKYLTTNKIVFPSGETIEGIPATDTFVLGGDGYAQIIGQIPPTTNRPYRNTEWTTATTGTASAVVLNESHDLQVGETITFFIAGARATRYVTAVSGQTITLNASLALSGTSYLTIGGGFTVYRTKKDADVYYQVAELSPTQFTAGYTDMTADSALVTAYIEAAVVQGPPPGTGLENYRLTGESGTGAVGACVHQGRICVLYNNTVAFSSAESAFYWDPANSFTIEGVIPQGVASIGDILYIFFSDRIYYVQGRLNSTSDADPTYAVALLTDQYGCKDPKSIIKVGDSVWFVSQRGLARLSGTSVSFDEGVAIHPTLVHPQVVTAAYFWRAKNLLLLSANQMELAGPTSSPNLSNYQYYRVVNGAPITLVYDFNAQKWSRWNIDTFNGAAEYDGDLLVVPTNSPNETDGVFIKRLSDGCNWTDSGVPFTARYYTQWYDDGDPGTDKSFNRLAVFSTDTEEAGGQGFSLTVRTEKNWGRGSTLDSFSTDAFKVGQGYAETPYATQPYGDPELPMKVFPLSNQKVKSLRVVLENAEPNRDFCINAVELESATKYLNMKDT